MSDFTSCGFEQTPAEIAASQRGSKLTDGIYRGARIEGFDPYASVLRVYLEGAREGGYDEQIVTGSLLHAADVIYKAEKAAGLHHGEALDEVFLAGYVAARSGAFA